MKILKGFKNFIKGIKQGNMGFEIINKCLKDNVLKVKDIKPCHLKEGLNGFYDIKEQTLYFDIRLLEKTLKFVRKNVTILTFNFFDIFTYVFNINYNNVLACCQFCMSCE